MHESVESNNIFTLSRIFYNFDTSSKKNIFKFVSDFFSCYKDIPHADICHLLAAREKIGTTNCNNGCALPRAKIPQLQNPLAFIFKLRHQIIFDNDIDNKAVNLISFLLLPELVDDSTIYITQKWLSFFQNNNVLAKLYNAMSKQELYDIVINNF